MDLNLACMVSVKIVHCTTLTLNMWSSQYLQLSGIISDCTSFCVVAFSVSAACATLIPHRSLKPSCAVFKCRYADKKTCGCLMLVVFFGGSGTVSMWMYFTSCSVTSLANCRCYYLVALSISIVCLPDIRTLSTSLWLKRCVLNMMSSSSAILRSSSSTYWQNLMPILDIFSPQSPPSHNILLGGTQSNVDSTVGVKSIWYLWMRLGISELETRCWGVY